MGFALVMFVLDNFFEINENNSKLEIHRNISSYKNHCYKPVDNDIPILGLQKCSYIPSNFSFKFLAHIVPDSLHKSQIKFLINRIYFLLNIIRLLL